MDIIHAEGEVSAASICHALGGELSNSAVRTFLRILEKKGHLVHRLDGVRYCYRAHASPTAAKQNALQRVLKTFFNGSPASAAQMLVESEGRAFSDEELNRLEELVRTTKMGRKTSNHPQE